MSVHPYHKGRIVTVFILLLALLMASFRIVPAQQTAHAGTVPPLLVTELMAYPNDPNEAYEYIEIYNNSSTAMDLVTTNVYLFWDNTQPFSSSKIAALGTIEPYPGSSNAIIGAYKSKVIWLKKKSLSGTAAGSLNGFNTLYGTSLTSDDLVMLQVSGNGLPNGLRRDIALVPAGTDPAVGRIVGATFVGGTDFIRGESVDYYYPIDGSSIMQRKTPDSYHRQPFPGTVDQTQVPLTIPPSGDPPILELVSRKSFDYFWNTANTDPNSPGYGLVPKGITGNNVNTSSTAGVGFGLAALAIGAERGWVSRTDAETRAIGTLNTLLNNVDHEHGFLYHFVNTSTGKRNSEAEASSVDTVRAVSGAIVAGQYFGGTVKQLAQQLYDRVDWQWMRDPVTNQFYKGYRPDTGYGTRWTNSGEQLALYVLAAGSSTHPVSGDMFYGFNRNEGSYGTGPSYIYSWFGSMHTYLYSHAWVDFRNKVDLQGVNWYDNSQKAVQTNRQYSIDMASQYSTYGTNAWGLLAGKGPNGYEGKNGAPPSGSSNTAQQTTGTLPPAGAAAAIVFAPQQSIDAMNHYYNDLPELWGPYGFYDGVNLAVSPAWYADDYSVINVGGPLLMIENYRSGFVWRWFTNNASVQAGMKSIGLSGIQPPADVLNPSVSWGSGSATVSWSEPAETMARSDYTFVNIYRQDGTKAVGPIPQGVTTVTITGLTSGSSYTFKVVRVKNGVESGGVQIAEGQPF
ncbi:glucoamylase family protein [Paenibacillus sp. NPDC056579]|uniref:glucoamylase family protein n=1 Tax=Paenibacillus sp. NPDC056579 TaxID=3345871 RepID=UPI0036B31692